MATPTQPTPDHVLIIARIAQMLAQTYAADQASLNGGSLDERLGTTIYNERMALQNLYSLAPNSVQLQGTANYVYSILGQFAAQAESIYANQSGAIPVVTGPSNQSVNSGATATFTISVTSALPYAVQWYRNGVAISGATTVIYSFTTQLSDSGATFYCLATNAAGTTASATATLTVTSAALTAYGFYGPESGGDPYPALAAGTDTLTYQVTSSVTHNQPIAYTMPSGAANNQWIVLKVASSESDKTIWYNTALNNGTIGDSVFRSILTINGFDYYISRTAISLDTTSSPNLTIS